MNNYLTIGTLWKDEYPYAEDFIKYHRKIGVEKFIIFDREYNKLHQMIGNYPDVEIIYFPETPENNHMEAWGQLIKLSQNKTKWLALIDADQCLVPVKTNNICDILKDYEEFASLQINWRAFGSGGKEFIEPGSVYERFIMTCDDQDIYNFHTQVICQPNKVLPIKTSEPHYVFLKENEVAVNTNKELITSDKVVDLNPNTPLSFNVPALHDTLYVNHYTNKSKEEWLLKNAKGRADIVGMKMPIEQFEQYESICNKKQDLRALEIWLLCL